MLGAIDGLLHQHRGQDVDQNILGRQQIARGREVVQPNVG